MFLHDFSWSQKLIWVVGTELNDERPVDGRVTFFPADEIKILLTIGFVACVDEYLTLEDMFYSHGIGVRQSRTLALIIGV